MNVRLWTDADRKLLRAAYAQGGRRGALAAFPDRGRYGVLGAIARYCDVPQRSCEWSYADVMRLRAAHRDGGQRAAIAAFPDRSRSAVVSAIRRYRSPRPIGLPVPLPDRAELNRKLAAIPFEQLIDRLNTLLLRRADFEAWG